MKPKAKLWVFFTIISSPGGIRPANHQTGAGDNAVLSGLNDASVHTGTQAKVIRINDKVFGGSNNLDS